MRIKVKKMYNGHVSVRDYIIKSCRIKKEDLIIEYEEKFMTIPLGMLTKDNGFQFHRRKFKSKWNDSTYELIDFKFKEDDETQLDIFKEEK